MEDLLKKDMSGGVAWGKTPEGSSWARAVGGVTADQKGYWASLTQPGSLTQGFESEYFNTA